MIVQPLPNPTDELPRYGGHGSRPEESGVARVVEKFSHLVVGVTDLDGSEAWYRDVLGLDVLGRDLTGEERPHSVVATNSGQLFILVENKETYKRPERTGRHQALLVTPNAYIRAYERLQAMGYDIADTHEGHRALGNYSIDIQDPDGHRYQIQTYGPEAHEFQYSGAGIMDCGPAERFKVGDVRPFKTGNFHLVRLREGFVAISRWCTHMNGIVVYQKPHWHFYCPMHDATYDCRGIPSPYPGNRAGGPLRVHPITFSDEGHVLVNTDEAIERDAWDKSQAVRAPAG
jgi:catechol 2,3-dioxygenase-like lactoylglutathione lyase family enzyme/nitrite reductase/ring-hydroxylating ferredoxin subunit